MRVENVYEPDYTCRDLGPSEYLYLSDRETSTDQVDLDADGSSEFVRTKGDRIAFRSSLVPGISSTWTVADLEATPALTALLTVTRPGYLAPVMFTSGDPSALLDVVQDLEDEGRTSPVDGAVLGPGHGSVAWESDDGVVQSVTERWPDAAESPALEAVRIERVDGQVDAVETSPAVPVGSQPVVPFLLTSALADESNGCGGGNGSEAYIACVHDIAGDMTVDEWLSTHAEGDVLGEVACRER